MPDSAFLLLVVIALFLAGFLLMGEDSKRKGG